MPLSCQSSRREVERTVGAIEVFLVSPPKRSWLDHILLKTLNEQIIPNILPETRCGIRSGRGTVDIAGYDRSSVCHS